MTKKTAEKRRFVPFVLHNSAILNLTCFAVATRLVDTHTHTHRGICSVSCTLYISSNTRSSALLHKQEPSVQLGRATWSHPAEPTRPFGLLLTASTPGPLRRLMRRPKLNCAPSGSPAKEWPGRIAKEMKIKWRRALQQCIKRGVGLRVTVQMVVVLVKKGVRYLRNSARRLHL